MDHSRLDGFGKPGFWGKGIVLLRKNFLHFSLFGLTEDFLFRFLSCAL